VTARDRRCPIRVLRFRRSIGHVPRRRQRFWIIAAEVFRGCPGPARVFPLGFAGQAVRLALRPAQPFTERHRVVPAHIYHRVLVGLLESRIEPGVLRVLLELAFLLVPAVAPFAVLLGFSPVTCLVDEPAELATRDL